MGSALVFALVLFVMGGATAYMGDRLGSYIGKKRHSSFGLRPRHTAMLWTVVSGGAIAVLTLLLLLVWDSTVKTALLHGARLVAENGRLEQQRQTLTRRSTVLERQAQADSARAAEAQAQAAKAQAQAQAAQRSLQTVAQKLGAARDALVQSRAVLAQRQAALTDSKQQLASTQKNLGSTHAELSAAEAQVQKARTGVKIAQAQYRRAVAQVVGANKQVLQANRSVLKLGITQDRLQTENGKLHTENDALARRSRDQQSLLRASQGGSLIFRREEELGRTVINARQDTPALRRALAAFLDRVELTARQAGAGKPDNSPAVLIPAFGDNADTGPAAREAALDALSDNIASHAGFMPQIVVVATARHNAFKGEPVALDLRPYANIMVFPKGSVVASGEMDGREPEDVLLEKLRAFLTEKVRAVALQRGVIPIRDPQSGEPLVGEPIALATWQGLVRQIQQAGPDARITAVAPVDIYSADLLHLDLRVTPASPASSAGAPAVQAARPQEPPPQELH